MAELTPKERLQPSLLDRLTDEHPDNPRESRDMRVLSPTRLRESVRRDLAWLFNTCGMAALQDLDAYPQVKTSVLNYGVPSLAGRTLSTVDVPRLEKAFRQTIIDFEPRLVARTVRVRAIADSRKTNNNAVSFFLEAELWAQPLPIRLFLKTDVDLETGEVHISEAEAG